MKDFKEFQAKNLDQAIQDACAFFGAEREKLEIEIIEDAKMGVFGLIGARKAKIRAKMVELPEIKVSYDEKKKPFAKNSKPKTRSYEKKDSIDGLEKKAKFEKNFSHFDDEEEGESQRRFLSKIPVHHDDDELDDHELEAMDRQAMQRANLLGNMTEAEILAGGHYQEERTGRYQRNSRSKYEHKNSRGRFEQREGYEKKSRKFDKSERQERTERGSRFERTERKPRQAPKRTERPQREVIAKQEQMVEFEGTPLPKVNLLELEQEKLLGTVKEVIGTLVSPIVGNEAPIEITVEENRVLVRIESEDSGLLIGREGQHLAAIQYLAARIITTKMEVQVRVQLDTGDYHQRQDARMQSLALMLAERVRKTGRSQSTRPMSAYQRRVVHLALQDEADVITRSVGEGMLKRVVVMRKRGDVVETPEELQQDIDVDDDIFMADDIESIQDVQEAIKEENLKEEK